MTEPLAKKRVSTPLVLVSASVMVSIGVVAMFSARGWNDGEAKPDATPPVVPREVAVDQSTPERAAESWLDAWRTRSHAVALRLSSGVAREKVELRRTREEEMTPEDRALGEAVWKQLADTRLRLRLDGSENQADGRLSLRGRAVGEWMGRPYVRRMEFLMEKRGEAWFVSTYRFFEDEPDLAADPSADPGTGAPHIGSAGTDPAFLPDGGDDPRVPGRVPERPPPPPMSDEKAP